MSIFKQFCLKMPMNTALVILERRHTMLTTVTDLLAHAARLNVAPMEAKALLAHALSVPRAWLVAHDREVLPAAQAALAQEALQRRAAGEPVAYVTGQREFYGLMFNVSPAVLIPRPETEWLVDFAVQHAPPYAKLADIGCGSGVIAVATAHARNDVQVTATDVSAQALQVAQGNARQHQVQARVQCVQGDVYAPLAGQRFDMVISNPPYIAQGDVHLQRGDLRFEPPGALTDGADGLAILRRVVAGARQHLQPGGWLAVEHGHDQAAAVQALFAQAGLAQVRCLQDLAGLPRNTVGRAP
jgi:release factor glutamine methyltransferase